MADELNDAHYSRHIIVIGILLRYVLELHTCGRLSTE